MISIPDVLKVEEVAQYLRVTKKTVYTLIKRGELPSFRIGRALRCRRRDVVDFVDQRAASAECAVLHGGEQPEG